MLTWKVHIQRRNLSIIKMKIRGVTMLIVAHGKMWNRSERFVSGSFDFRLRDAQVFHQRIKVSNCSLKNFLPLVFPLCTGFLEQTISNSTWKVCRI